MEDEIIAVNHPFDSLSPTDRINLITDIQNITFHKESDYSSVIEIDDEALLVTSFTF